MDREFEKISFKQFKNDIKDDYKLYEDYVLPYRKTKYSAGYDFIAMEDFEIKPNESKIIATGYKARFKEDEMLLILVRSSMGFKYNVRLCNQVAIIESDYYDNINNEGHLFVKLQNEGKEVFKVKRGDAYAQGIFTNFLTCGDTPLAERNGGIGSTNERND